MDFSWLIKNADSVLTASLVYILFVSICLTIKTKFIQLRMFPHMIRLLVASLLNRTKDLNPETLKAHRALFTAMSTTLGIGNIVGPAVAIRLGGPGALVWLLIILILGGATIFSEVVFALRYRVQLHGGFVSGGPMEYLAKEFGRKLAATYAFFASILLVMWSSNQSNTLADILTTYDIPHYVTGIIITSLVLFYLIGGIKKIGSLSAKIVPLMFFLYCGTALYIIISNMHNLSAVLWLMVTSAFSWKAVSGATVGYSIQNMLRWGLAKGIQAGEAGIGSVSIPHSKASNSQPIEQGILAMVSVYAIAFVSFLSGLVTLSSGTWNDTQVSLGINMIAQPFKQLFPSSIFLLICCVFLFAFGTILGNAFNGSQCYLFLTNNRWLNWYHLAVGIIVFFGTIADVKFIWSITDFFIIPVALINVTAIMWLSYKYPQTLSTAYLAKDN